MKFKKTSHGILRLLKSAYFIFIKFILRIDKRKYILLEVRNEIMFSYAFPFYNILKGDNRLKLIFCFNTPHRFLNSRLEGIINYNQLTSISHRIAKYLKWDLILFPDHGWKYRKGCKKIYIGHGLSSGKRVKGTPYVFGSRSLDEKGDIIYDKIVVNCEFISKQAKQLYPKFSTRLSVVGSFFADEIMGFKLLGQIPINIPNFDNKKKTIMIASTWGPLSLLQSQGRILRNAIPRIMEKYNIIFCAHLLNFIEDSDETKEWRVFFKEINNGNFFVNSSGGNAHLLLLNADLLITDMTSLGLYFPILERPVVILDNPEIEYDSYGFIPQLIKYSYAVRDMHNIENDIENAFASFNPSKMQQFTKILFPHLGEAVKMSSSAIYETLSLDPLPC